jgi:hypothetical protein
MIDHLTHERFCADRKERTESATEGLLKDGTTPFANLMLASDGCFQALVFRQ